MATVSPLFLSSISTVRNGPLATYSLVWAEGRAPVHVTGFEIGLFDITGWSPADQLTIAQIDDHAVHLVLVQGAPMSRLSGPYQNLGQRAIDFYVVGLLSQDTRWDC